MTTTKGKPMDYVDEYAVISDIPGPDGICGLLDYGVALMAMTETYSRCVRIDEDKGTNPVFFEDVHLIVRVASPDCTTGQ